MKTFRFDEWHKLGRSLLSASRTVDGNAGDQHKRFMVALGQAGLIDRDLSGEVAKMEVSLVRHNLHLRRLVLRYAKALILMIWTIIVSFLILLTFEFVRDTGASRFSWLAVIAFYGMWLLGTPRAVRLPIDWIYEWANRNASRENLGLDPELTHFENQVKRWCTVGWLLWGVTTLASTVTALGVVESL